MDSPISMIDDICFELKLYKSEDKVFKIELIDLLEEEIIFSHRCDTFATGDLILHLKKGIKKFISSKGNRIVLSRWYPDISSRFLCSNTGDLYITPVIQLSENGSLDNGIIEFTVNEKLQHHKFTTTIKEFYDLIK